MNGNARLFDCCLSAFAERQLWSRSGTIRTLRQQRKRLSMAAKATH
jgi:hypothetical protein